MTATSAARDATNRDEFFAAVVDALGVEPELLSGEAEAAASFRGATAGLDPAQGPFLVFDLGGGSTEFAVGTTQVEDSISLEVGCVRLTEKYIEHDPPEPEELVACISLTEAWLDDVARGLDGATSAATVVGLAGTVSTVAAVEIGLATYDRDRIHHFVLTREAAEDVFRTLATETRAQRIANPGLEEARADVIVAGCCALVAIMRFLDLDEILVSESDILDGLALSLLDRAGQGFRSPRRPGPAPGNTVAVASLPGPDRDQRRRGDGDDVRAQHDHIVAERAIDEEQQAGQRDQRVRRDRHAREVVLAQRHPGLGQERGRAQRRGDDADGRRPGARRPRTITGAARPPAIGSRSAPTATPTVGRAAQRRGRIRPRACPLAAHTGARPFWVPYATHRANAVHVHAAPVGLMPSASRDRTSRPTCGHT